MSRQENIVGAADALHDARLTGTPIAPIRSMFEEGDVKAAYAVQRYNIERRVSEGERLVGRKIGITTKAVQQQLGIDECDYGALFVSDFFREDEEIPAGQVIQPMVESEVAFILENDLKMERPTTADVIGAVAYCLPAIEVVDSRIRDWDIGILDTIADNASGLFAVLGGVPTRLETLDVELCGMKMEINGSIASVGVGAACLGNPLNAVAWLAQRMVEVGMPLGAGDIVLSGALGPFARAAPGDVVDLRIAGLGRVAMRFGRSEAGTQR